MNRKTKKAIKKSMKNIKKTSNFLVEMAEDFFDDIMTSKIVKNIKKKIK